MATGKALVVGVSKPLESSGWINAAYLSGVDDDVRHMKDFLENDCHFDVYPPLLNSQGTHDAVLGRIEEAAETLGDGDFFVFFYSGHGGSKADDDGDEGGGNDEFLLTYDEAIRDDELAKLWVKFDTGVRILTLVDSCHSGTIVRKATARATKKEAVLSPARPLTLGTSRLSRRASRSRGKRSFILNARLIHISACADQQKAQDLGSGGAFTLALLKAMQAPPPSDYNELHQEIQRGLPSSQQSELHAFGPLKGEFLKQAPFKISEISDEQIAAAKKIVESLKGIYKLRGASARDARPSPQGIILSRPPSHRLDLVLNGNSITDVPARAYVLGLFEGVTPAGAAAAIDDELNGTIRDLVARRMFSARVGEVFMVPTGNSRIQCDVLLLVGLGQLSQFQSNPQEVQKLVAGNMIRTLITIGVDEFATVLIGGGSGQSVKETLTSLVQGFVGGLRDADPGDRARRVILCENDSQRYSEIVNIVYTYSRSESFRDIGLTIYERPPQPADRVRLAAPASVSDFRSRIFLQVRHEAGRDEDSYESILLTAGGKATAIPSSRPFDPAERDVLLRPVGSRKFDVEEFGEELAQLALSEEFIETLSGPIADGQHLIVVHDAESSKLPWETLRCGDRALALDGGISRKYLLSGNYSIAKWLEKRRFDETLDILLVVNPTEDLDGAEREGEIIRQLVRDLSNVVVTPIWGKDATRKRLLGEFKSGAYDVIHYAGHAWFDETAPENSGILCHDHDTLSGSDLATISDLPALVFFNACESGRVRKTFKPIKRLQESVSFAEAFLRGGIANFIGTYWPVGDASAEAFAKTFYGGIVKGEPIGDALLAGRRVVEELGSYDWADYIHYGDPDFRIKEVKGN